MHADSASGGRKALILIAEDVPKNMEIVCNLLRKEGYRLAMAGNGKQALDMVPMVQPDLILMDVMMPEMDGFEACRLLKESDETKDIPVIFLTAKADTADLMEGFRLGAVDYVTKPFKGGELVSRVKTHLELKLSKESLKELNATKDKFFSIIAHDLKDPLQYLLLSAETMFHKFEELDDEKKKDYVFRFYRNTRQLSSLLENLLEWARTQRGHIQVETEKIPLLELVDESMALLKGNAEEKDIRLISEIPADICIYADKNMMLAVFRNLLANGIKFTHPGGKVVVEATDIKIAKAVEIIVSDSGIGMNAETLKGLFKLESKKSQLGTAREKGTGLGLILCREFILRNSGKIQAASEVGKGTRFTLLLPSS